MSELNAIMEKLDTMNQKIDSMDQKIDKLDEKMGKLRTDMEEKIEMTEYALRRESESIYQVVCDNHKEVMSKLAVILAEDQQNQAILKLHTKKFNNLRQALS